MGILQGSAWGSGCNSTGEREEQTSGGALPSRPKPGAKANRRNGVTGAAEGSRYHPRHSNLGRVCSLSSFWGKGGRLQLGRQLRGVDPGKQSTPALQARHDSGPAYGWSPFKATSCYALVAVPMGSMMIRVRLDSSMRDKRHYLRLTVLPARKQPSASSSFSRGWAGRGGAGPDQRSDAEPGGDARHPARGLGLNLFTV